MTEDDIEETTSEVQIVEVLTDTKEVVTQESGQGRHFRQKVKIADSILSEFLRDVRAGETVRVTVETNWGAQGLPTRIVAFEPLKVLETISV